MTYSEIWLQVTEPLTSVSRLRPLLSVVVSEVEISESFLFRSLNETVFFLPRRLCHVKKTFQFNFFFSIFWSWREKPQMGQNVARHFSQRLRSLWFDLLWKLMLISHWSRATIWLNLFRIDHTLRHYLDSVVVLPDVVLIAVLCLWTVSALLNMMKVPLSLL